MEDFDLLDSYGLSLGYMDAFGFSADTAIAVFGEEYITIALQQSQEDDSLFINEEANDEFRDNLLEILESAGTVSESSDAEQMALEALLTF